MYPQQPGDWHLVRVGMSTNAVAVNLILTVLTCGAWLPFAVLWWLVARGEQQWIWVPAGQPVPGGPLGIVPIVAIGGICLLVLALVVALTAQG